MGCTVAQAWCAIGVAMGWALAATAVGARGVAGVPTAVVAPPWVPAAVAWVDVPERSSIGSVAWDENDRLGVAWMLDVDAGAAAGVQLVADGDGLVTKVEVLQSVSGVAMKDALMACLSGDTRRAGWHDPSACSAHVIRGFRAGNDSTWSNKDSDIDRTDAASDPPPREEHGPDAVMALGVSLGGFLGHLADVYADGGVGERLEDAVERALSDAAGGAAVNVSITCACLGSCDAAPGLAPDGAACGGPPRVPRRMLDEAAQELHVLLSVFAVDAAGTNAVATLAAMLGEASLGDQIEAGLAGTGVTVRDVSVGVGVGVDVGASSYTLSQAPETTPDPDLTAFEDRPTPQPLLDSDGEVSSFVDADASPAASIHDAPDDAGADTILVLAASAISGLSLALMGLVLWRSQQKDSFEHVGREDVPRESSHGNEGKRLDHSRGDTPDSLDATDVGVELRRDPEDAGEGEGIAAIMADADVDVRQRSPLCWPARSRPRPGTRRGTGTV